MFLRKSLLIPLVLAYNNLMFLSCNSHQDIEQQGMDSRNDTSKLNIINKYTDTSNKDDSDLGVDTSIYKKLVLIDTIFTSGSNVVKVVLQTKSDSSKSILLPAKYLAPINIKSFYFYESYSSIQIYLDNKLIYDTILNKSIYLDKMDSALIKYGNLLFPEIRYEIDTIEIGYSLSIPLTDVGIPVFSRFSIK